ncbi:TPA: RAQPRD family integrative conjugative element protein [Serratia marcescens]
MRIPVVTRGLGAGFLLGLSFLIALPVQAAEKDELASAQRMLVQVQAALERARVAAVQADPSERGRFFFDYARATSDLKTINAGIDRYLEPSRAQPRDGSAVAGNYRRERP